MGAAAGSEVCIANVIRICARYANLDTLEDGYGINMLPLATFALECYKKDPCNNFKPKFDSENEYSVTEQELIARMHKAIAIIQFKLEGEVIKRRPDFNMDHRLLLNKINYDDGTIELDGKVYKLNDTSFPTIDKKNPYKLTKEEKELIEKLKSSFVNSEKLQRHIRFLFTAGSIYLKYNSNLMFHGCIPLNEDGTFREVIVKGKKFKGKGLLDEAEKVCREGYFYENNKEAKLYGMDYMWYQWTGPNSSLFGKDRMTTFERYFIDDKNTHKEAKNTYYKLRDDENMCNNVLKEFGLDVESSHIINGHIPVERKKGESPIKANGKLLVIDGGFSKAYQGKTGMAGYTLIYNSFGLQLISHEPFKSTESAIKEESDILSSTMVLERVVQRKRVEDTDVGQELMTRIKDLKVLLSAYRKGLIKEKK